MTNPTKQVSLIKIFIEGPDVSLNGSPTVSPVTAALCASEPFFSILPFSFNINKKKFWNQPLIIQKEVGILGILKKRYKSTDYYLLQAKIEPGNTDNIQLSPTVQATKSNYLRK